MVSGMNLPARRIDELIARLFENGLGMSQAECCFVERKLGVLLVDEYMHGVLSEADVVRRLVKRNALAGLDGTLCQALYTALEKEAAAVASGERRTAYETVPLTAATRPAGKPLIDLAALAGVQTLRTAEGDTLPQVLNTVLTDKLSSVLELEEQSRNDIQLRGQVNAPDIVMQAVRIINTHAKGVRTLLAGVRSLVLEALNEALFASGLTVVGLAADRIGVIEEKCIVLAPDTSAVLLTEQVRRDLLERLARAWTVGEVGAVGAVVTDAAPLASLLADSQTVLSRIESVYSEIIQARCRLATPYLACLAPAQRTLVRNALKSAEAFAPTTAGMCLTALLRQHARGVRLAIDPFAEILCSRGNAPSAIPDFAMAV